MADQPQTESGETQLKKMGAGFKPYLGAALTCPDCGEIHTDWARKADRKTGLITHWQCLRCGRAIKHEDMGILPDDPSLNNEQEAQPGTQVEPPPSKPTLDEYITRGIEAVRKEGDGAWEVGYNYMDMVRDCGLMTVADYGREIGIPTRTAQDRVRTATFYEGNRCRKFRRANPKVTYTYFRLAIALGNEDSAYGFLSYCSKENGMTPDKAEYDLYHDAKWGLVQPDEGGSEDEADQEDAGDEGETETTPETLADNIPVCLSAVDLKAGTLTLQCDLALLRSLNKWLKKGGTPDLFLSLVENL